MSSLPKPGDKEKEKLQTDLNTLLVTTQVHGELREAAEQIAKAFDTLIHHETAANRQMFEAIVSQAMTIPNSSSFKSADPEVRQAMLNILGDVKDVMDSGLNDLVALNEKIKQEKKKLKDRIKQIEQDTTNRFGPRR